MKKKKKYNQLYHREYYNNIYIFHWRLLNLSQLHRLVDLESNSNESREILHFNYTTWPDFGVPQSPTAFLRFLVDVRESGALGQDVGPPIVHCSAGIGRSGTFCLVDTCLILVRRINK